MNAPSSHTLLLIDDCAEDRVTYRHFLEQDSQFTYRMIEFGTAEEALQACQQELPDLVLLDWGLLDRDGGKVLQHWRTLLSSSDSAVIILAEQADADTAVQVMKGGAQDYLVKAGLTPEVLQRAVQYAIKQKQLTQQLQESRKQQHLMASIALQIRQSLQLDDILQTTATEVRQLLKADRVLVYQFQPDRSGTIVAESVLPGWTVALSTQIQDPCFQQGAGEDYRQGKTRAIDDIDQAGLTDCHVQLLKQFEVKANLIVPILVNDQLWGLLLAHQCSAPRHWQTTELELLDHLAVQIAIAIQQASAYEQAQRELTERKRTEAALRASEEKLKLSFNFACIGYWEWNLITDEFSANDHAIRYRGFASSCGDLSSEVWFSRIYVDDRERVQQELRLAIANHTQYISEYRVVWPDGNLHWISAKGQAVYDAAGQPLQMLGVMIDISDRKQAEEDFRQNQERLNLALEAAGMGTWDWNIQAGTVHWSVNMERLFGMAPGSFDGKYTTVEAMIHPSDRAPFLQAIQRAVNEREEYNIEFRFIKPDGTERWALSRGRVFYDDMGMPIRMMGVDVDNTDRKQAEAALSESEARFQAFMNNSPSASWITDEDGRVFYLSGTYLRTFQLPTAVLDDWIGTTVFDMFPADIAQQFVDNIRSVAETKQVLETIEKAPRPDGTLGDFLVYKFLLPGMSGRKLIAGVAVDISERVRAEQALQQLNQELEARVEQRTAALQTSEERFRNLVETSSDWVWEVNEQAVYTYVSPQTLDILGYRPDEMLGKTPFDFMPAEEADRVAGIFAAIVDARQPFRCLENQNVHRDGYVVVVESSGVPIFDDQGCFRGYRGVDRDITDRKQAEAELLALSSLQQAILNGTDYAIISVDPSGVIQTFNAAAQKMLGYTTGDIVGQATPFMFHDPEEIQQRLGASIHQTGQKRDFSEQFISSAIHAESSEEEWTFVRQDGSRFPVSLSVKPLHNAEGQTIGGVGFAKDITHQKQIEAQLRQTAAHLAAAQRIANLGSWELDLQTLEVVWSEEVFRIFGRNPEAAAPTYEEFRQLIHPDDLSRHDLLVQQAIDVQQPYETEYRSQRSDGRWIYLLSRGEVVLDSDGDPVRMVGTMLDITDRKQAEKALQESRTMLRLVLDTVPQRVFWKDRASRYLGCNPAFADDCQLTPDQIVGKTDQELPWARWAHLYVADDAMVMNTRTAKIGYEEPTDRSDGKQIWLRTSKIPLTNSTGEVIGVLGSYEDITDRKQSEEQLQQTNNQLARANIELARATRLKDEFMANMSHELRTPLNAVLGMSEGLQEEVFGSLNDRQRKAISTIERSGRHLLELINDILDLSKIESGKFELELSTIPIKSLCEASLTFVQQMALKKQIQLNRHIPDQIGRFQADDRRLRQALINLLSNAVKFTLEGGAVTLEVSRQSCDWSGKAQAGNSWVLFSVIDTGIGIAPENFNKLFQPFVQIDSSLNRQYNGTGLGLALVRQIAELHGGTVTVSSELGQGSRFTLWIPDRGRAIEPDITATQFRATLEKLCQPGQSGVATPTTEVNPVLPAEAEMPAKSSLILLAEDNPANVETISSYLESRNYRIIRAANGQEAIERTRIYHPDLILMDIQMPGIDGLEAMRQIRSDPEFANLPMIALTALAMSGDREKCLAAGATEYFMKPVRLKQLVAVIQQLLHL